MHTCPLCAWRLPRGAWLGKVSLTPTFFLKARLKDWG